MPGLVVPIVKMFADLGILVALVTAITPGRVIVLSESDNVRMEFVRPENGREP